MRGQSEINVPAMRCAGLKPFPPRPPLRAASPPWRKAERGGEGFRVAARDGCLHVLAAMRKHPGGSAMCIAMSAPVQPANCDFRLLLRTGGLRRPYIDRFAPEAAEIRTPRHR
jgi:hypothetical protein